MLHSILYLVALHRDLKHGMRDSPECLHHGGEALSIINRRIGDTHRGLSDSTIAAVALLVNRENLDGRYDVANVHMQGLHKMVKLRGGIQTLSGVHQRIITWSDFCHANVWDQRPAFSRLCLSLPLQRVNTASLRKELDSSGIFDLGSSIVEIIQDLRILSKELDPEHIAYINRLSISNLIYNVEYELLLLNEPRFSDFSIQSYSMLLPLKIALHLYLYLIIREIPNTAQLIGRLSQRLQDVLEPQIPGFWTFNLERKSWLLWILFVGSMAVTTPSEIYWFTKGIQTICKMLGIDSQQSLLSCLKRCVWQENSCSNHCALVWEQVKGF